MTATGRAPRFAPSQGTRSKAAPQQRKWRQGGPGSLAGPGTAFAPPQSAGLPCSRADVAVRAASRGIAKNVATGRARRATAGTDGSNTAGYRLARETHGQDRLELQDNHLSRIRSAFPIAAWWSPAPTICPGIYCSRQALAGVSHFSTRTAWPAAISACSSVFCRGCRVQGSFRRAQRFQYPQLENHL